MIAKKAGKKESILKDYVEFKFKVEQMTKELDAKKKEVVEVLLSLEDREAQVDDFKITLRRTTKWEYSKKVLLKDEAIKADNEVLKMMKKEEEETGKAKLIEESYSPVVK